ncbi:cation:proton antiporter [Methanobrevibacter sp. 87.7]|uniref:Na+/H+ antiporter subunit E n=1 Tax=Methanobrevibacter sp. 87.7 TaxID=387957 RepID=UPI000B509D32|nr:Na+/H+ antiporter subunit E [Methanobrevibacter sp. 87.7]OWT33142.1 cation:proton antiporter [Methanobrevibacter sp. 87.7]
MFLKRVYYGIIYFLDLLYEIVKATYDVSVRTVHKDMIEPVVVDIHTDLERTVSQTILANSITLTPGTLTVDLIPEDQIIKVAIIAPRDTEDIIPFEKYIKKMLE